MCLPSDAERRLLGPLSAGTDDWPLSATAGARPLNAGPSESICRSWFTRSRAHRMTDTPRLWDRRADETPKSYAAFRAYVALGARRSVREAARHPSTTLRGRPTYLSYTFRGIFAPMPTLDTHVTPQEEQGV